MEIRITLCQLQLPMMREVQRREIGQGILNDQVLLNKAKSLQSKLQVSFPLLCQRDFVNQFFIYIINMSQKGEKIQFFK
jgi:hypothetical protein